ncbi:MAG: YcxB family protein [Anaerolineaceae bacterium]
MTESPRQVIRFVTTATASSDARALVNSGWTRIDVIVDAVAIVVGLAFVASGQWLGIVLVVLALVALASTRWHPVQRWLISWRFRSFLGKPTLVTIDDEGVRFTNEVGTSVVPWVAVTAIRSNDVTTIFVRDRAMLGYIPADAFPTAQTRAAFIEFANGRLTVGRSNASGR